MASTQYVCQTCGAQSPKWSGQCRDCGAWNSLVEERVSAKEKKGRSLSARSDSEGEGNPKSSELLHVGALKDPKLIARIPSGISEVDRVLGGGLVPGSLLLFGGEPGIGKSTLLLQVLGNLSAAGNKSLYLSGEESAAQVGGRFKRLKLQESENLFFLSTTELEAAIEEIQKLKPKIVIVDSVQTLSSETIESAAGTVSQIRMATHEFLSVAKNLGVVVILVGHVTKEGTVAGPRLLEHMVDGVFYFELATSSGYRLLRGQKNRFGATHEVAVFEMRPQGLMQVENPSARFLAEKVDGVAGSSVVAHLEGSRPFLTEFQALCQKCYVGYPRRTVQGIDQNRIAVLMAVAEKTLNISFSDQDVYCKVASGDRLVEPAVDLAVLMALISAVENRPLPADLLFVGEVGLGGEIRSVPNIAARIAEAKTVGIKKIVLPQWNLKETLDEKNLKIIPVKKLKEAYAEAFNVKNKTQLDSKGIDKDFLDDVSP